MKQLMSCVCVCVGWRERRGAQHVAVRRTRHRPELRLRQEAAERRQGGRVQAVRHGLLREQEVLFRCQW